jgi:hypothetical protein
MEGRTLPRFVRREFEEYLKCGLLEHGFLRVRCTDCHADWVPSVPNAAGSVPVAVPGAWWRVPRVNHVPQG